MKVATAQRSGQRLVAVILGIKARNTAEGDRLRTASGSSSGFRSEPALAGAASLTSRNRSRTSTFA